MIWQYSIGNLEVIFICLFVLFYLAYVGRVVGIARKLHTSFQSVFVKVLIRGMYFTLLVVAILGPSYGETTKEIKSVGKDIFIAVDLSQSMNAYDVQPSRLEKVKYELKKIVASFGSDRIGLIIFSSEAFVQCPLTYDQNAINLFIETLHTSLVPNAGTDFGPPLQMALDKLTKDKTGVNQQKSKIIVLISDGEDFGENTASVAQDIDKEGIKLFALGVGSQVGSKIRQGRGFKKDRQGNEVTSKLNTKSLKQLATDTEGKYFEINPTQNDVARLVNTINAIEGELRDARKMDVSANKYYYFLLLALVLILLDVLTNVKTIKI